jgi:osmotically-inducible protein OsmY
MKAFSDEEIKNVIVNHLNWNTKVDASGVMVGVNDGLVTLTGIVKSHGEKQEAFESARHVSGVRAVNNEIMVFHSPEMNPVQDKDIEAAVRQAFVWNPHIDEETIEVRVKNGIVTLTGCIKYYSQRLKAEKIVSELSGVKGIVDELSIVCTDKVEDEHIAHVIKEEIRNTGTETGDHIAIHVNNGFVDISGSVDSYPEEKRIFDVVSHTHGVTGIKNNLEILISPKDNKITSNPHK